MRRRLGRPGRFALSVSLCLAAGACGSDPPPAPKAPAEPAPTPAADGPVEGPGHSTGTTYDDALAVPEDMASVASEPELTNADLSGPMRTPAFLNDCNVKDSMHVRVRVVVRDGSAIGVTVLTAPDDATVADCIDKAVRAMTWPKSKRRDSFTTTF